MRPTLRNLAMAGLGLAALALPALAQDKPKDIKIGITTFLSGPAAVFGEPSKAAAEMIAESLNKKGGIGGVPVTLSFVDEGAGGEALVSNYRRLVQDEKVDATFASISSGSCNQLVPLAEDLKMLNFMWDCGAASILEAKKYRYNFRTQANATPEMLAVLVYLLKTKPNFKTIAVVNQDYAWGRESWEIFSTALKQMKPDVQVVAELFPKFGAPDYSTEVKGLLLGGVVGGGPAEQAGLKKGDVIVEIAGQTIANIYDYTYALDVLKIGQPAKVVYMREGKSNETTLTPSARR